MGIKRDFLDDLFSEFIRKRDKGICQRCLTQKYDTTKENGSIFPAWQQLDCAHMHTRRYHSVKWDEENSCALFGGCHLYLDSHPQEKIDFFKQRLGEEGFDLLNGRKRMSYPKPDCKLIEIYLREKLREIENV